MIRRTSNFCSSNPDDAEITGYANDDDNNKECTADFPAAFVPGSDNPVHNNDSIIFLRLVIMHRPQLAIDEAARSTIR